MCTRTILKRVNGIPGLSHEKQGMPPKLGEDEEMGHGYVSRWWIFHVFLFFFCLLCSLAIEPATSLGIQVCMSHLVICLLFGENVLPQVWFPYKCCSLICCVLGKKAKSCLTTNKRKADCFHGPSFTSFSQMNTINSVGFFVVLAFLYRNFWNAIILDENIK